MTESETIARRMLGDGAELEISAIKAEGRLTKFAEPKPAWQALSETWDLAAEAKDFDRRREHEHQVLHAAYTFFDIDGGKGLRASLYWADADFE